MIVLFTDEWGGKHVVSKKDCTEKNIAHWIEVYSQKTFTNKGHFINLQELEDQKELNRAIGVPVE